MENHRRSLAFLLPALLALLAQPAHAQLPETPLSREAGEHLLHGNVKAGLALFLHSADLRTVPTEGHEQPGSALTQPAWKPAEALVLARLLLRTGAYADAREVLLPHLKSRNSVPECVLAQNDLEKAAGTLAARLTLLGTALKEHPGQLQVQVALGAALYESGKPREARKILDPLADRYENGEFKEPLELVSVAESLRLNGYVRDANRVLEEASQLAQNDQERLAVELPSGLLFVSKYNYRDGDKSLKKVLAIDPKNPQALAGMARIDLKSDQDVAKARKRLDALLQDNPRDVDALLLRAEVGLHDEDYATAQSFLERARQVKPENLDTLAVKGAYCQLTENPSCFAELEKASKKLNPDDGRLWLKTGEYLEMAHRYRETLKLLQTAIQVQPDLWQAHAALGMGYARIADDVKAKKHLETAYGGDPFDVRTANQLNVLYDGVLKQMVTLPGPKVDLRVHRKDRKAFEREMLPFVQEALTTLEKKYAFVAEKPIQVEIFPETEQFSVRTVGLPQLGAHAVCFGHLVTSRSPSEAPFNWKMVLWHELSHVFHIQMTDGRVPRWLTEGLAMMESAWANPRWAMRMDRHAWDRLQAGQLAKVAQFNLAFSQARSMQDIVDAYYQAMLLTEFLSETHGFDKLRNLVAGYKTGATTADLVQKELGVTPSELDRTFALWLRTKLQRFEHDFRPYLPALVKEFATPTQHAQPEAEEEDEETADVANPPTPTADSERPLRPYLAQALAELHKGKSMQVLKLLTAGLAAAQQVKNVSEATQKDLCTLHGLQMDLLAATGNRQGAALEADALVKVANGQCDGVKQRAVLALANQKNADPLQFVTHLAVATGLDPQDGSVAALWLEPVEKAHNALVQGGENAKKPWILQVAPHGTLAEVRARLAAAVDLDVNDPKLATALAKLAWQDWKNAKTDVEKQQAALDLQHGATALMECDPAGRLAVLFEARALQAMGQLQQALLPYRLAAERGPSAETRAEAWCELADLAAKIPAKDDAAEAQRRCAAERTGNTP